MFYGECLVKSLPDMEKKLDIKPPREDWFVGAITYNLEQLQTEERRQMYGPGYLDIRIEELQSDLEKGEYKEEEEREARIRLEKYKEARRNYENSVGECDDADDGVETLSPWAIESARIHCITYVARQLIIEKMRLMNQQLGKYYGNDIAHRVRAETGEYLTQGPALESDVGKLISYAVETYHVLDMDEDTIDLSIAKAREIFNELMLTDEG